MASKSMTLFVTLHVAPNNLEKLYEAHRPIWASVGAEPDLLLFDVFQSTDEPGKVRFVEVWSKDRAWFESVQLKKPYYERLWTHSKPLWTKEWQLEFFERQGEGFEVKQQYLTRGE